jgi:hypothetical protein
VAEHPDPLPVLDATGTVVGTVDRGRVLTALAGSPDNGAEPT